MPRCVIECPANCHMLYHTHLFIYVVIRRVFSVISNNSRLSYFLSGDVLPILNPLINLYLCRKVAIWNSRFIFRSEKYKSRQNSSNKTQTSLNLLTYSLVFEDGIPVMFSNSNKSIVFSIIILYIDAAHKLIGLKAVFSFFLISH